MRSDFSAAEGYRRLVPPYASAPGDRFGRFTVPFRTVIMTVVVDDGELSGWEHVSVSLPNRCPNWTEMCFIKALFWSEDETVVQFHPCKSDYVNVHPNCLHLWARCGNAYELPPKDFV